MNAGHYFRIGSTHRVCQDYAMALTRTNKVCAVVSDGCSTARDTDFGSRILARVCASNIWEMVPAFYDAPFIGEAHSQATALGLPVESLHATLLWALATKDYYHFCMHGDGVVVKMKKDGTMEVIEVEFPSGAPYYLSYQVTAQHQTDYRNLFGEEPPTIRKTILSKDGIALSKSIVDKTNRVLESTSYQEFGSNVNEYENIVLMSDGAQSFLKTTNTNTSKSQEPVSLVEMLQSLLPFKNYQGDFVERRAQRFFKDCEKAGWQHSDDFSIAAIHIGD